MNFDLDTEKIIKETVRKKEIFRTHFLSLRKCYSRKSESQQALNFMLYTMAKLIV